MITDSYKDVIGKECLAEYEEQRNSLIQIMSSLIIDNIYIKQSFEKQWNRKWEIDIVNIDTASQFYIICISHLVIKLNACIFDNAGTDVITLLKFKNNVVNKWIKKEYHEELLFCISQAKWNDDIYKKKVEQMKGDISDFRDKTLAHNLLKGSDVIISIYDLIEIYTAACELLETLCFGKFTIEGVFQNSMLHDYFKKEKDATEESVRKYRNAAVIYSDLIKDVIVEPKDGLTEDEKKSFESIKEHINQLIHS